MGKQNNRTRLLIIAALFVIIALGYTGRLLYLQVSGQDYYTMSQPVATYTRTVPIQAMRGEIYDRNGEALVRNVYSYTLSLDYASRPDTEKEQNDLILALRQAALDAEETEKLIKPQEVLEIAVTGNGLSVSRPEGFSETSRGRKYEKLIKDLNVRENAGVDEEVQALLVHFGIIKKGNDKTTGQAVYTDLYEPEEAATLLAVRLDMALSGFSAVQPYPIAKDISVSYLSKVVERFTRGWRVTQTAERVYLYPGFASHILGYTGKIPSDQVEYYTAEGYPMDAIVGLTGAEAAFEQYLRGTDGELTITEDSYGNVLDTKVTKEPVAGQDVYLTLDIGMQITAERALAEDIIRIRETADPEKPLSGEDASSGALTVLDVHTSEVLAIVSYPTFNLATFWNDYSVLRDDPLSPMYNRALSGTYAPGSTFKVGVAVAALTEGIIEKDTIIDAQGEYRYYEEVGFTPRCWIYLLSGQVHGKINVVEAIQESCNYFFYDVGRRLTIEKMNEYSKRYGFGQPTGIELPEKTGILAGPAYRAEFGLDQWSPGDTLQAAIGQSDNLFTPLQLNCYLCTVLNGGTRNAAHLLKEVRDYATGEVTVPEELRVLSSFEISDEILETVKEGMKGVMDRGSAASVFSGYGISVGGKTGTAQVYKDKSDNAIMVAFAPFEEPEIVVTSVIEQGADGTAAGVAIRDVFDYYFADELAEIKAREDALKGETEDGDS